MILLTWSIERSILVFRLLMTLGRYPVRQEIINPPFFVETKLKFLN